MEMGISDRRERERSQRRSDIVTAAWGVAESVGWGIFSVEKVAAHAELGRATVYGYFDSLEQLVLTMGQEALEELSARVANAPALAEALDVPVRFSQSRPAAFALLFPPNMDLRPPFAGAELEAIRKQAHAIVGRLERLASRAGASLPEDAQGAAAFLAGISIAGAVVPELRSNTPLRRRWQDFCLGLAANAVPEKPPPEEPPPDGVEG
jgi:AcrR family transcriptional regulator